MTPRLTMGYRRLRAHADNWLWPTGEEIRGHEFHYSTWTERPTTLAPLYQLLPWKESIGSTTQAEQWEGSALAMSLRRIPTSIFWPNRG